MAKASFIFKFLLVTIICVAIVLSSMILVSDRAQAAASFSLSASDVSNGAFTVTLTIPAVTWNTYNLVVSFDHTVVQTAEPTHSNASIIPQVNVANGNSTGTYKLGGVSFSPISEAVTITMPFTVVNDSATSVQISMTVTEFALNGEACKDVSAATPVTVTLKTVVPPPPPPSSDESDSSVSSSVTDEGGDSDLSDTPKPPVSSGTSDNSGTSDVPNSGSSKPVSSETPSESETSDSGTVTDSADVSDTESELLTSESDVITETDLPVTDTSDPIPSQNSDVTPSSTPASTVSLGTQIVRTDSDKDNGLSPVTVTLLLSLSGASIACFVLTWLGLRRHKVKDSDAE